MVWRCRRSWATRWTGEWAAEWDSMRCEVLGNVEDMSDDEGTTGCSESLFLEAKSYRG